MRKLAVTLLILLSVSFMSLVAQTEKYNIGVGGDPKLAVLGAYDYDKTPVADLTLSLSTNFDDKETGIMVEYANLKDYYFSFGIFHNREVLHWKSIDFLLGGEVKMIQRGYKSDVQNQFLTVGVNGIGRWNISDDVALDFRLNPAWRRDLENKKIGISGFVELKYTFKHN